ncbi:MAG: DUF420 domain-containing protein [Vicinamibacteria bacterium]|nr:DUF420 domain-containing protein [Vicinamibacteria bacterium]
MEVTDLPRLNAALNLTSAVLLFVGWRLIRAGRREAHRACMIAALCTSALFLASYLVYHFQVGSVRYTGQGPLRTLYFAILLSHTILAVVNVPLVIVTATRALRERFPEHKKIARRALPIWFYVSVTGVVIYLMLYGV